MAYKTHSSAETKKIGVQIAKQVLTERPRKVAQIFALTGDLGAGKTTFVQGFFRGLGLRARVVSPTFIIMRRTSLAFTKSSKLKAKSFLNVYHIDAYRLKKIHESLHDEFKKIFKDPQNIVLIEWAENIKKFLPKSAQWIRFEHGASENLRTIRVTNRI